MATFVITGTLSRPRAHYVDAIERAGGIVSSSVTSKTDYLLCGEDAGSKLDKALSIPHIEILDERAFWRLIDKAKAFDSDTEVSAIRPSRATRAPTPRKDPPLRIVYLLTTERYGENQAMFDEDISLLGAWHLNDAYWRGEYLNPMMKALGIEVRPLPRLHEEQALCDLCDHMGYDYEEDDFS